MYRYALAAAAALVSVPASAETVTIDFEPGTFSLFRDEGLFRIYESNGFRFQTTGFVNAGGFLRNEVTLANKAAFGFTNIRGGFTITSLQLRGDGPITQINPPVQVFNPGPVFQTFGPFDENSAFNSFEVFDIDNIVIEFTAVPEPATWAMMIAGFALAGAAARRQRPRLVGV